MGNAIPISDFIVRLAGPFARVERVMANLGWVRDPDRTDVSTCIPGEPSFASWSRQFPDDREVDYHFDPDRGERWLQLRGERAAEHAAELATALGGTIAGTIAEGIAALLTPPRRPGHERPTSSSAERWRNLRVIVAAQAPAEPTLVTALLLASLGDPDWRVRMTALIGAARFRVTELAPKVTLTEVPQAGQRVGLEAEDRRVLLAMRQAAADLLRGATLEAPVRAAGSEEDDIGAMRLAYQLHLRRLLANLPEPSDRAAVLLTGLLTPNALEGPGSCPDWWQSWLF
jgi:hypothetical protein